jgi:hypothetical protein
MIKEIAFEIQGLKVTIKETSPQITIKDKKKDDMIVLIDIINLVIGSIVRVITPSGEERFTIP